LPAPGIASIDQRTEDMAVVSWEYPCSPEPLYQLLFTSLNVVGATFKDIVNSDTR